MTTQPECITRLRRAGISYDDAVALRRISMTLHRWHELECGNSNNYASWAIERDGDEPDSTPYMVTHTHTGNYGYSVWCYTDNNTDGTPGEVIRATRRTFSTREKATEYAATIHCDRKPVVREVFSRRKRIADRETGALKRLDAIMARYPDMSAYVQGDPRGASLYILRPDDVPNGADVDCYYSRGIAVYK